MTEIQKFINEGIRLAVHLHNEGKKKEKKSKERNGIYVQVDLGTTWMYY